MYVTVITTDQGIGAETHSLGGSGSGKTTLLNAVAHRLGGLPIEDGEVAYYASSGATGAAKLSKGEVKRRIGFVRQQDFLVECLTGELLTSPHLSRSRHS